MLSNDQHHEATTIIRGYYDDVTEPGIILKDPQQSTNPSTLIPPNNIAQALAFCISVMPIEQTIPDSITIPIHS